MKSVGRIVEQVIAGMAILALVGLATAMWRNVPMLAARWGPLDTALTLFFHFALLACCAGWFTLAVTELWDGIYEGPWPVAILVMITTAGFGSLFGWNLAVMIFWPKRDLLFAQLYDAVLMQ